MMDIGKMEIRKELAAISMGMESTWANVTSVSDMVKESISSRTVVAMKASGKRVKERGGESISMQMDPSTQVSINLDFVRDKACTNTLIKKYTKVLGKKIRKMVMG